MDCFEEILPDLFVEILNGLFLRLLDFLFGSLKLLGPLLILSQGFLVLLRELIDFVGIFGLGFVDDILQFLKLQ
jgi:hypothetical protein